LTLLRSRESETVALDSLDEVSSGEMQDFDRASGNVSDLWDQVTPCKPRFHRVSWRNIGCIVFVLFILGGGMFM
jgi:hypothetical protein